MADSPRRQRATLWAWAYLALFGSEPEPADATGEPPGDGTPAGETAGETAGEYGTG